MKTNAENMHLGMDDSGEIERVPLAALDDQLQKPLVEQHLNRYRFCSPYVSGKKVLDAACGIGFGSQLLAQAGAQFVDAIDYSGAAIGAARQHYAHPNVRFKIQDILSLSGSGEYDVVVSFETIEHIPKVEKYLKIMHDALKEDGLLFVSTPNRRVTNPGASRFDKPKNLFHVFEFTLEEFVQLLNEWFHVQQIYAQCPHYYKGTKLRTVESIFMSRRLRRLLHLSDANYRKLTTVRPLRPYIEPMFFVAQCQKARA